MGVGMGASLIASLIVLAIASAALVVALRCAAGLGLLDYPDARKRHAGAVPLVGGISILAGLLAGAVWVDGFHLFDRVLVGTAVALVAMGVLDDRRSLRVRVRVLIQSAIILVMICSTGTYVRGLGEWFGIHANLGWAGVPFTLVAMIGLLNAFNLIDGIDGLASSLGLVAIAGILLTTGRVPSHTTSMLLVLLAVAVLPQLASNLGWFGARWKCFLGDAGSTLLGYIIGWALIRLGQTPGSGLSPVGTLWCVALPVLDTLSVMYRRIRNGRSPFKPGRTHIHYLLLDAGFGARATLLIIVGSAIVIWCIGAVVRALSLGAGSNLIAFLIILMTYIYATGKLDQWVSQRRVPVIARPAQAATPATDATDGNDRDRIRVGQRS